MVLVGGLGHGAYIVLDGTVVAGFECPDIDDHIDLARAVKYRSAGLVGLDIRQRSPKRKTNDRTDRNAGSSQKCGSLLDPARIYAD